MAAQGPLASKCVTLLEKIIIVTFDSGLKLVMNPGLQRESDVM